MADTGQGTIVHFPSFGGMPGCLRIPRRSVVTGLWEGRISDLPPANSEPISDGKES
jgi:hypothetical protein